MDKVNVIVETPRGSGYKYDYDPQLGKIKLNKVMPAGLVFPFDFGFIPGTVGGDGDPLDVIVISEFPAFSGCAVACRIIGALKVNQQERGGQRMRNDRLVGIPVVSELYANVQELSDLPEDLMNQIIAFFTSYNQQAGKKFKVTEMLHSGQSLELIRDGQKAMPFTKLVELFLPLYDNQGKHFGTHKFKKIRDLLTDKFGGITEYTRNPASGFWKKDDEQTVKDMLLIIEVMCAEVDMDFWNNLKVKLLKSFQQDQIVIRCSEIHVI
jgi:inorganic pyrophosphatase